MAKEFSIKPKLPKIVGAIIIIVAIYMVYITYISPYAPATVLRFVSMFEFKNLASIFLGLVNVIIITFGVYILLTGEIPLELKIKK
jgi:multisubunit Na+/H+ antiporter MnhB subunit